MSARTKVLLVVTVVVLVIGSLYLRSLVRWAFFERRRAPDTTARAQLDQAALQASAGPTQSVTLYFPSYAEGKLRGEARPLALAPDPPDRVRQIVLALIEGPKQGAGSALSASAEVRGVFLTADGTVYLDLSNAATSDFNPGIESETLAVYSVVDSLAANLPEVKKVQFLVQGQEVDTLDGHADLTEPFAPDTSWIASPSGGEPGEPAPPAAQSPGAGQALSAFDQHAVGTR
jgi:Sporulation and spore germination